MDYLNDAITVCMYASKYAEPHNRQIKIVDSPTAAYPSCSSMCMPVGERWASDNSIP